MPFGTSNPAVLMAPFGVMAAPVERQRAGSLTGELWPSSLNGLGRVRGVFS